MENDHDLGALRQPGVAVTSAWTGATNAVMLYVSEGDVDRARATAHRHGVTSSLSGPVVASAACLRARGFGRQQRHEVRLSLHGDFISELQSLNAGATLSAVRQRRLGALATPAEEGGVATGKDRRLRALAAGARHGLAGRKGKQRPARPRRQGKSMSVGD